MSVEKLENILIKVADIEDITNYEVHLDKEALRGDGFLSENFTGTVKNKNTGEILDLYIKKMPDFPIPNGPDVYCNENHFYSSIWAELDKFQNDKDIRTPFKQIPKFYCGSSAPGEQYICLENLKTDNFDILEKSLFINENLLNIIFKTYGKFHALTFAFKNQNIEKYTELVNPIIDVYDEWGKSDGFLKTLTYSFKAAYEGLKDIDEESAKKIKPHTENIKELYERIKIYDGPFSTLTHGDCWSNNLLFKYKDEGTVDDIKLIDFQLCRDSTPIHDLSYFFYSGASVEDFKKLDEYLELYHKSFSDYAKELGSDPEKLLPLSALKSEWRKHSLFGIFMGLLLWQIKLIHKEKLTEPINGPRDMGSFTKNFRSMTESRTFRKNTSDLLLHALEQGIL